ncbi:MAG: RtcB family protein [Chlorobium sp.]|nr:MAG: RtcB family protein [Chlorobium sp.]
MIPRNALKQLSPFLWEIPQTWRHDMLVPARVYASEKMLDQILQDRSLEQLVNVSTLPGIVRYALAMPDVHEGYGFPVGGVAAFDLDTGIISPGGIGYDINCGVRLLRSSLTKDDVVKHLSAIGKTIFSKVPSGVGKGGSFDMKAKALDEVLNDGAKRMVALGYGEQEDLEKTESGGQLESADASCVSVQAKARGHDQLGTLGAGNHFVEVEYISAIYDDREAERLGLQKHQVCVMVHTGSRGLGHQVATDAIRNMNKAMVRYGISLPDRELACVPFNSSEGREYLKAMSAAANFAWANRQVVTWEIREAWKEIFGNSETLSLVYDVAHNIAKLETYEVDGMHRKLIVHRKGATRAFPGQPVLIPGSMGTGSYLLSGLQDAMNISFGSSCHGAGRTMSRTQARKNTNIAVLLEELSAKGIVVNAGSREGISEEAPSAYKNVDDVVQVIGESGIAKKIARLKPLAVIKG